MKTPQKIVVLGGGFAGLWSALGAARQREECGLSADDLEITLVSRDPWHAIRVRNYETDISEARVPLDTVLGPVRVRRVEGEVTAISPLERTVSVASPDGRKTLDYDRLIFALGSQIRRPFLPGLAAHTFDVDTYAGAARLAEHLRSLPGRAATKGRNTVLIVGAGLTGIETAAEMPDRLRPLFGRESFRVILADHQPTIGAGMGDEARPVIAGALAALGVETRTSVAITAIDAEGAELQSGGRIATETVVWCAGMEASPLTGLLPVDRDWLGRLPVNDFLRVDSVPGVFAAGDSARLTVDETHDSMMSCQHSRPMGRFAGHNAVRDLLGLPLLPLQIDWYVTVLDLGAWGALYTEGWDRRVAATGATAKNTKMTINRERIYPPLTGNKEAILAAAAPVVQTAPAQSAVA